MQYLAADKQRCKIEIFLGVSNIKYLLLPMNMTLDTSSLLHMTLLYEHDRDQSY